MKKVLALLFFMISGITVYAQITVHGQVTDKDGWPVIGLTVLESGTRFRSDYLSFKYFGQDGWGSEKGKMLSPDATVELTANAAALLKDAGDLMLKDGVQLVPGATYVLTIDLSVLGKETIDFYKQD